MAKSSTASVGAAVDELREKENISLVDIVSLAETSVNNLRNTLQDIDSSIFGEFKEIAVQISSAKAEIRQLSANDLKNEKFPEAGRELQAIVESTEDATHQIMEAAETIMTADASDPSTYHAIVNDNIMSIFEACSFQDLTGQRISKVVDTMEIIEKRVNKFTRALGAEEQEAVRVELDKEEAAREKRKKELILNGPALDGPEVSQNDIDDMF